MDTMDRARVMTTFLWPSDHNRDSDFITLLQALEELALRHVSLGTVDMQNMHFKRQTAETVAEHVAGAVAHLASVAQTCNIQLLYIIPGYTQSITEKDYNQFTTALQSQLSSANNSISIGAMMTQISNNMNITEFEHIVDNCTSDGLHLTFETGQHLLTAITSHFSLPHTLPVPTMSNQYFAVQKILPSGCYRCGQRDHNNVTTTNTPVLSKICAAAGATRWTNILTQFVP